MNYLLKVITNTLSKNCKFALVLLTLLLSTSVFAGSQSNEKSILKPEDIASFAKNVEIYAAENGARAFIIARVGRPQKNLPKGIKFTHTAVAIYSTIELANGEKVNGYAIHNLYQNNDNLAKSSLVMDYPVDFFWGVHQLSAGIIIPNEALQQRLIETIASGKNKILHNEKYSVIANPFNNKLQNCTEHTLDIINASIYETTDIKQLKMNAKAHFKPQRVNTSPLKLMFGSMLMDDVTTRDHSGKVYTATFTTIAQYLQDNNLVEHAVVFHKDGSISSAL